MTMAPTTPRRQFTAADDLLHAESATGPLARESLALTARLPEHNLLLMIYIWREGATTWGRFVFVAGTDPAKPDYLSFEADAIYAGDDLRDFTVSGLRDRLAHDRYEQPCLTSGRLRGRQIDFTAVGHRDHCWGTRDWRPLQHWKWMNAATPDGALSLHAMKIHALGETLVYGYLNRGAVLTPVTDIDVEAELDSAMTHRRVWRTVTDSTGASTLNAEPAAGWSMPIQHLLLHEVGMSATLGARPAPAHIELGWPAEDVKALTESS